jgi:hypothetical protein
MLCCVLIWLSTKLRYMQMRCYQHSTVFWFIVISFANKSFNILSTSIMSARVHLGTSRDLRLCSVLRLHQGQKWDFIECGCVGTPVPSTDSSPSPSCIPQSCPRGYIWGLWGMCQCVLACDYIMECPAGQKWDFIECGCVGTPAPSASSSRPCWINCQRGYRFDSQKCECIIYPEDPNVCNLSCPSDSVANYDKCQCDSVLSSPPPSPKKCAHNKNG